MGRPIAKIIEKHNNNIPPLCPIYGMWGGTMTICMAVPTKKFI